MIGSCVLWNLAQRLFLNTCWGLVSHELSTRTLGLVLSHTQDICGMTLQGGTLGCAEAVFNQTVFIAPTSVSLFVHRAVKKMWCVCWGSNSKEDSKSWALEQTVCTEGSSHCWSLSPLTCKSRKILIPPSQRRLLRGLRGLSTIQNLSTVPTYYVNLKYYSCKCLC